MYIDSTDNSCWYVLRTKPKQEDRAINNLKVWRIETFSPKIKERGLNTFTGAATLITKPLFPRYVFAKFNAHNLLHKVVFTRGVESVVDFGNGPSPVDEMIIQFLKSRVGADGFMRLGEELKSGDRVIIKNGPLKNFCGIIERALPASQRVLILINTLSYSAHIEIEKESVENFA